MFSDPSSTIAQFGLKAGMHVADLGAGSGSFTIPLAKALSPNGKVYACEVQKELLTRMKNDASAEHITNIEYLWSNIEKLGGTKLGDRSMDGVTVSNVLFIVEDREGFLAEMKRILKPAGHVYFIDWSDSYGGMGPHPDQVISEKMARDIFAKHGFEVEKTFEAGAHHYGLILKKN